MTFTLIHKLKVVFGFARVQTHIGGSTVFINMLVSLLVSYLQYQVHVRVITATAVTFALQAPPTYQDMHVHVLTI